MSDPLAGIIQIMRKTQVWVFFLSLVGFFTVALIALLGFVSLVGIETNRVEAIPLAALIAYPVAAFLYLVPSLYLYKYARRIRTFAAQGHHVQLEAALEAQRHFWKFTGMIVLLAVGLTVLALIAAIVIGTLAAL